MPIVFTKPSAQHIAKIVEQVPKEYPDFKKLDEDLVKFYQKMRLTSEMIAEREEYVRRLQCYLTSETGLSHYLGENGVWIRSIVKYGSMATHCATRDSDMDICICASYSGPYQPSPTIILQGIYEDLQHNYHAKEYFGLEGVTDLVFVSTAKVPILKFKMNGVEVDMSVSFDTSPPKSVLAARLINAYCQLDERFTILVIFLKSWMKSELSNTDFMRDFPNSYSLILMVIHVLQWHGIMPNLHETHAHLFDPQNNLEWQEESMYPLEWSDVMSHQQRSTNTLSVAQLLHIFSTQYSNNIIINCCKLDIRSGMLETRGERDNAPIFIQDVFDTRNPARSVRGIEMVQALQCVSKLFSNPKNLLFQRIWRITRNKTYLSRNPDSQTMEEDVANSCEQTPTNSTYGTPVRVASPCAHSDVIDDVISGTTTVENSLYSKCNAVVQEKEMERLEAQNAEYREKLLRTIRERDLNEELLKNVQNQHKKELETQTRRIRELEVQLKSNTDRSLAQEAHFNVTTKEMTQKYTSALQQATKKADQSDKEKNEAVVKYAMREGEMMKLKEEIKTKDAHLKACKLELEASKRAQSQDNLDQLEKTVQNLKVEMEKLKHERFDFENRMKIAEKRVETLTATLTETKQQGDVLRKQLINAKDDKHLIQQYETKLQTSTADLERRLQESDQHLEKLRTSQLDMATKFEESSRENSDLLSKIDILQDQLSLEEDRRKLCEEQIERLKGVESFVESSSHRIEETEKEKMTAEEEKEQAELEASEMRSQVENMLKLTQELTERNMELQRKLRLEEDKVTTSNSTIEKLTAELTESYETCKSFEEKSQKLMEELENLKLEVSKPVTLESLEENFYRDKYEECAKKLEEIEAKLAEEKNNFSAYKKKANASLKELKSELSGYRKTNGHGDSGNGGHGLVPPTSSDPSMSSRSRNSSITSIDRVTSNSREEDASSAAGEEARRQENEEQKQNIQQVMIDKIVILQRKLARRTEKCEFLEEHVRQCLEELQKKTKIIQHFALREEASLLMPSEESMEKLFASCEFVQVPVLRKSSAYALMGAMFTLSGSEKKQTQILTEVNSRLQAVLEDVIQRNICMRSTVDTLTADNTRLSRENRLLCLSQVRPQSQEQS